VDHGSPVVVSISYPSIISNQYIPNNQTGIELFGRVFPSDTVELDYSVTLSNGRGPMDEVYDLDENKAVGLRLKLIWAGEKSGIAVGGYGYYGQYSDTEEHARTYLQTNPGTSRLSFDDSEKYPVKSKEVVTEKYNEVAVSADLQIDFYGVSLFGEYVWRRVYYKDLPEKGALDMLFTGMDPNVTAYGSDYIGMGAYGLLAYTLPLDKWLGQVKIIPWGAVDWMSPFDYLDYRNVIIYRFGINIKPSPYVVIKTDIDYVSTKTNVLGGNMWILGAQVAVTF
jgi:hypothetical protein